MSWWKYRKPKNEDKCDHHVYVLECEKGVKYVGRTSNLKERMESHNSGEGSEVTKKFKVKKIIEVHPCKTLRASKKLETAKYYECKEKFGKRVRGAGNTNSTNL